MIKSTITSIVSPIWLVVISLVTYWIAIAVSRWDYLGNDLANVYSLVFALFPAFLLQISSLCLYFLAFKRNATDFKMPNYWMAFIGSLAIIQFFIVGLFLTLGTLFDIGDTSQCPSIPTLMICDIARFTYSRSFLIIQDGLWLPLGLASMKASTKVVPSKKAP